MSDIAIQVENLSKLYHIGARQERHDTLRDAVSGLFRHNRQTGNNETDLWALKDVSFEVKRGEVVGIIGRNGAGKSTLLKILSRITEPTNGEVRIRGRLRALLEIGTGFHPELTGRENIFMNGAILGMRRAEIDRQFDEIVAFSDIEKFLDTPVKRYSSGMYVRLAFAVAAHLEPEILIVDEVLAVGDAAFQEKCLGKIGSIAAQGRTVVFVSHNMPAIISLCTTAYLLETGCMRFSGTSQATVDKYMLTTKSASNEPLSERTDRYGDGTVRMVSLSVESNAGRETIQCGDGLNVRIGYVADDTIRKPAFLIGLVDHHDRRVYFLDSRDTGGMPDSIAAVGAASCATGPINLPPGMYSLNVAVLAADIIVDHVVGAVYFEVVPSDFFNTGRLTSGQLAICLLRQKWTAESPGAPS